MPMAAGILLIIASIDGLINWTAAAMILSTMPQIPAGYAEICGVIGIIFCLIALLGGFCAVTRKMWFVALFGAIFGLLTIGVFFEASVLSLIALILIAMSKNEFY